jgi:hypothetical protein
VIPFDPEYRAAFAEDMHAARLAAAQFRYSLGHLEPLVPIDEARLRTCAPATLEDLDALGVRFARLQDLLGARVFRSLARLEAEEPERFLDLLGLMEKRGLIDAERWLEVRRLRNRTAHEYADRPGALASLLADVFRQAPYLLQVLGRANAYARDRLGLDLDSGGGGGASDGSAQGRAAGHASDA